MTPWLEIAVGTHIALPIDTCVSLGYGRTYISSLCPRRGPGSSDDLGATSTPRARSWFLNTIRFLVGGTSALWLRMSLGPGQGRCTRSLKLLLIAGKEGDAQNGWGIHRVGTGTKPKGSRSSGQSQSSLSHKINNSSIELELKTQVSLNPS